MRQLALYQKLSYNECQVVSNIFISSLCPTVARPSSPGVRQLSVGEVRVSVRGERGVLGVRGEGRVSQALYPLGGGVGMATPER